MKLLNVDITRRLLPYATPQGIHVEQAELPKGHHTVRISIGDVRRHLSVRTLRFEII